jgi:outer membrane protein TolC
MASLMIVQLTATAQSQLDIYVEQGLANNESIKQQEFALERSLYALKEARALFYPSVSLLSDYFLADGGRTIDIPVGDIVNPIYNGLNELTGTNRFPQIDNASELLNPNDFYDVRFRTSMPLLNMEIDYNRKIKKHQVSLQELETDLYKRELVKEIKTAYFNYLKAAEAITIFAEALETASENLRINEALFKNDKANRGAVIRSDNEVKRFEAQVTAAEQSEISARAYFNFLLNRDAGESIIIDEQYALPGISLSENESVDSREELRQLQVSRAINAELSGLAGSYIIPKLSTFLDLGSQGFDGDFDSQTRYYFFGVSLQWDLFAGGKNNYRKKQAALDQQITASRTDYVQQQLQLQLLTSVSAYRSSQALYEAAVSQQESSARYYRDMLSLYKEGQALFIELLDAQNQWVSAQLQTNISLYDLWTKAADIERANASFNLNP